MKKILIPVSALFIANFSYAQTTSPSTTENYVYTKTYLDYNGTSPIKTSETVQYFDGLGRPKQIVNVKATPLGKDLVTTIPYDGFGRQVDSWLPAPMNTLNGGIQSGVDGAAQSYYNNGRAFTHQNLENSPLDRVLSQIQPGTEWQGHPVEFEYKANLNSEIRKYVTITSTVDNSTHSALNVSSDVNSSNGFYKENQLYKNSVKDEDGNETIEFKNGQGQTLLIRKVIAANEYADTYYVYNEYNQLAFVIPPKASDLIKTLAPNVAISETILNDLCYQYRYDGRNRLVEKKLPGKGWEYMVYDKADRLVLTQDTVMKLQSKWMMTKYDKFGRAAYTAIISGGERANMQSQAGGNIIIESRDSSGFTLNGMQIQYTNNHFNVLEKVLTVNYYDTYPTGSPAIPAQILGQDVLPQDVTNSPVSTKSLPLASYVKNIEDDNWTKNYSYYDTRGRAIGSYSVNHLGGRTKVDSKLDFAGAVQQTVTFHKRLDTDTDKIITENFTYDHQNRLVIHTHQVDSNPVEFLAQNKYNELSQLESKKVGGIIANSPLQQIDYQYNIRGWMTKINDPVNLNGKLFGYEMRYNNPVNPTIAPGRFNGNIAEVDWKNSSENLLKRYNYEYDNLNRLKNAFYKEPTTGNSTTFDEYLTYDLNGNINTLKRNATPVSGVTSTLVDDLEYKYTGNRLDRVIENQLNSTGYEGGNNFIDYDLNGNMTTMKDKGIQSIGYNYLSLADSYSITQNDPFGTSRSFSLGYLYRADGTKVRKTYTSGGGKGQPRSTKITDYLDSFQYTFTDNSICLWCRTSVAYEAEAFRDPGPFDPPQLTPIWQLDFVPTSEGFYSFTENRYIYQYRDHLGNARVNFAKNEGGNLEVLDTNNYYAFGMNHIGGIKSLLGEYQNYKYNSKELQETGMYDYGARMYMPDLGRWGVIDPFAERYIKASPYHYAFNNPIFFKDPDGRKIIIYYQTGSGSNREWEYSYSKNRTTTGFEFLDNAVAALDKLYESNATNLDTDADGKKDENYLQNLIDSDKTLGVESGEKSDFTEGLSYDKKSKNWKSGDSSAIGRIRFNSKKGLLFNNSEYNDENQKGLIERYKSGKLGKTDKINSPTSSLGHEIIHAGNYLFDSANFFQRKKPFEKLDNNGFTSNEEIRTTILSNQVNEALNEPQRKVYWGIKVPTTSVNSNQLQK